MPRQNAAGIANHKVAVRALLVSPQRCCSSVGDAVSSNDGRTGRPLFNKSRSKRLNHSRLHENGSSGRIDIPVHAAPIDGYERTCLGNRPHDAVVNNYRSQQGKIAHCHQGLRA